MYFINIFRMLYLGFNIYFTYIWQYVPYIYIHIIYQIYQVLYYHPSYMEELR